MNNLLSRCCFLDVHVILRKNVNDISVVFRPWQIVKPSADRNQRVCTASSTYKISSSFPFGNSRACRHHHSRQYLPKIACLHTDNEILFLDNASIDSQGKGV